MMSSSTKQRLSNIQIFMIIIASSVAFGHFVYVHLAILFAGRDAWISLGFGCILGLAIVFSHVKLASTSKSGLIDHAFEVFGPWLGRIVAIVYILFFMLAVAFTIKVVVDFMSIIYPTTPSSIFLCTEFSIAAWCCYAGIEVMGRVMQLLLPAMMILGISASLLSTPDKDFTQIYPVFAAGWTPVLMGSLVFASMFAELVAFSVLTEHVDNPKKLPKQALYLVPILFVMFLSPVVGPIMVFGEQLAKHLSFPTYTEIQYIRVTSIIERLDIIGVILWGIGSFFRIAMFTFAAVKGVSKLFNTERSNTYTIPITLLTAAISLSLMQASREEVYHFLGTTYLYIAPCVGFGIPLLTGLVAWMRTRFGKYPKQYEQAN